MLTVVGALVSVGLSVVAVALLASVSTLVVAEIVVANSVCEVELLAETA